MKTALNYGFALALCAQILGCAANDSPQESETSESFGQAIEDGAIVTNPTGVEKAIVHLSGCTGTLLDKNWVITARHCVAVKGDPSKPQGTTVEHGLTKSRVAVSASNIYLHPDVMVDVALLKLPTAINVSPTSIPLFSGEDGDVVGKTVTAYGYGSIDNIAGGCANGKSCPATYFCETDVSNCTLWPNLLANACLNGKACATGYSCVDSAHCAMNVAGFSKASFTVDKVVRDGTMQSSTAYNGRYLSILNSQGKHFNGGDSGGPTFINGQLVGVTGGGTWVTYAKVYRNWAKSIMSPATNNRIDSVRTTFGSNVWPNGSVVKTGDVNNDGYTDLVQFNQTTAPVGYVYVILGSANGYTAMTNWHTSFSSNAQMPEIADVDGDGKADIATFDQSTGKVFVAISDGKKFGAKAEWHSSFGKSGETPRLGDLNGDGRADAVTFSNNSVGETRVALSCGTNAAQYPAGCTGSSRFGTSSRWNTGFSYAAEVPFVGDVNQDGMADLVNFSPNGSAYVALTTRKPCAKDEDCASGICMPTLKQCLSSAGQKAATKTVWGSGYRPDLGQTLMLADMNGDGTLDAVDFETVTGSNDGRVGVGLSTGTSFGTYSVWGTSFCKRGHHCVTGDVNRDGRSDVFDFITAGNDSYSLSLR